MSSRSVRPISSDPLFFGRAIAVAAGQAGVSREQIMSVRKTTPIVHARYATMLALRRRGMSLPSIGRRLGRDHTTVLYALRRAEHMAATCEVFADLFQKVDRA